MPHADVWIAESTLIRLAYYIQYIFHFLLFVSLASTSSSRILLFSFVGDCE